MLKNKLIAGAVFALALFVAGSASAAYMFPNQIDTLQEKKDVQTVLNMSGANLTVDGVFGPKTISAVKTFQGSKNLTVDGKIGPMTRAALEAASAGPVSTTFPAGCTSAVGFSSTTGASCAGVVSTLPAGCTTTAGFSATTGAKCDGSTTTTTTDNGPLVGGAGSINAVSSSTDVNSYLVEGQADAKVLGFKVTATDSDAKVSNIKVTLVKSGVSTASSYLDRYVANVSVWMNGTKVATVNGTDFSKDLTGNYSKSISLDNAIVREGSSKKATFYVTITGVSNIDTGDMGAIWTITADNFRYQDATGVIMSYNPSGLTLPLTVKDISGTGDVKLVITKDSSSPAAQNLKVSDTGSTSGIPLLVFKAKNTGADMTFDTMGIDINPTTSPLGMIGELTLKANGTSVATWTPTTSTTGLQLATFDLDNTYTISKDSTTTFTVEAKINDIDNFTSGALTASYDTTAAAATVFEVASTRTSFAEEGAAAGETQTFFANGIVASGFTYGTPVVVTNTSGTTTSATYAISFKVTASGHSYYVKKSAGLTSVGANTTFADLSATGATDATTYWLVSDGDTATFTTTGAISSAASGFTKIGLYQLKYNLATSGADSTYTFSPASSFETSSTLFVD